MYSAAAGLPAWLIGLHVQLVAGVSVTNCTYEQVVTKLASAERPLTLTFAKPTSIPRLPRFAQIWTRYDPLGIQIGQHCSSMGVFAYDVAPTLPREIRGQLLQAAAHFSSAPAATVTRDLSLCSYDEVMEVLKTIPRPLTLIFSKIEETAVAETPATKFLWMSDGELGLELAERADGQLVFFAPPRPGGLSGLVLQSVRGVDVTGSTAKEVMKELVKPSKPMQLKFARPDIEGLAPRALFGYTWKEQGPLGLKLRDRSMRSPCVTTAEPWLPRSLAGLLIETINCEDGVCHWFSATFYKLCVLQFL